MLDRWIELLDDWERDHLREIDRGDGLGDRETCLRNVHVEAPLAWFSVGFGPGHRRLFEMSDRG